MSELSVEECLLCLRIPLGEILIHTFDLFDEEKAKVVGQKAADLLREAYLTNRYKMCGKHPSVQMASSIYLAGILCGARRSQEVVAKELGVSTAALRNRNTDLIEILGLTMRPLYAYRGITLHPTKQTPGDRLLEARVAVQRGMVKCSTCRSLPPLTKWEPNQWMELTASCKKTGLALRTDNVYSPRLCGSHKPSHAASRRYATIRQRRKELRAEYYERRYPKTLSDRRTFR